MLTPRAQVTVQAGSARAVLGLEGDRGTMRFQLEVAHERLRVGVLLAQRERPVDISADPAVLMTAMPVPSSAARRDDLMAVSSWLRDFSLVHGLFSAAPPDLLRGATGASFPLLAELYRRGAGTLPGVPRWAIAPLGELTARSAAASALGPAATRAVIAALAAGLMPSSAGEVPRLYPLALALMARGTVAPDGIARVVHAAAQGPPVAPAALPSVDEIQLVRAVAGWLGPRRLERLLHDAGSHPRGPSELIHTARLLVGLPAGVWDRLPMSLAELHERCVELTPVNPRPRSPRPQVTPERAALPPASMPRPRRVPLPRQALVSPSSSVGEPAPEESFRYPAGVVALHRRAVSPDLRLVLPRTPLELRWWGRLLHCCVGSFATAVAGGRSLLVGVERHDVVRYCVELTPHTRTIRQFHASHNRAVPHTTAAAVCRALLAAELLDSHHPVNRPWVDLCRSEN